MQLIILEMNRYKGIFEVKICAKKTFLIIWQDQVHCAFNEKCICSDLFRKLSQLQLSYPSFKQLSIQIIKTLWTKIEWEKKWIPIDFDELISSQKIKFLRISSSSFQEYQNIINCQKAKNMNHSQPIHHYHSF